MSHGKSQGKGTNLVSHGKSQDEGLLANKPYEPCAKSKASLVSLEQKTRQSLARVRTKVKVLLARPVSEMTS